MDRLGALFEVIREMNSRAVAAKYQLDIAAINAIAATPLEELHDLPWPTEYDKEEYAQFKELTEKRRFQRQISRELDDLNGASFDVSYDNGFRTSTTDLEQFKDVLRNELGRVESMTASIGEIYDRTGARVRFNYINTTATFDIAGERVDVDAVFKPLTELLDSATPDHPILHRGWFHTLAAFIVCGIAGAAILNLLGVEIEDKKGIGQLTLQLVTGALLGIPLTVAVSHLAGKSFPAFRVEFGDDYRRQRARQARFGFAVAVILIPIVVNLLV